MPPRFKSTVLLAFTLLVLYLVFVRDDSTLQYGQHAIDVFNGNLADLGYHDAPEGEEPNSNPQPKPVDVAEPEMEEFLAPPKPAPIYHEQSDKEEILAPPEPTTISKLPPLLNDGKVWTGTTSRTKAAKPEAATAAAESIGGENELPEAEALLEDDDKAEEPPAEDAAKADESGSALQEEFEEKYGKLGVSVAIPINFDDPSNEPLQEPKCRRNLRKNTQRPHRLGCT
jgi:hypothetical protein